MSEGLDWLCVVVVGLALRARARNTSNPAAANMRRSLERYPQMDDFVDILILVGAVRCGRWKVEVVKIDRVLVIVKVWN